MNSVKNEIKGGITLEQVILKVQAEAKNNVDFMWAPNKVVYKNGFLQTPDGMIPMNKASARQLAVLGGIGVKEFERLYSTRSAFMGPTIQEAWNKVVVNGENGDKPMLFRAKKQEPGAPYGVKVRAVLSSRYGIIDNDHIVVKLAAEILKHFDNPRFIKHDVTDHGMNLRMRLPLTDEVTLGGKDPHRLSLDFSNNEVGGGAFKTYAAAVRAKCLNLAIWEDVWGFRNSTVHLGNGLAKLDTIMSKMVCGVIDRLPGVYNNYLEKQEVKLPNAAEMLRKLANDTHGVTKRDTEAIISTQLPLYLSGDGQHRLLRGAVRYRLRPRPGE